MGKGQVCVCVGGGGGELDGGGGWDSVLDLEMLRSDVRNE